LTVATSTTWSRFGAQFYYCRAIYWLVAKLQRHLFWFWSRSVVRCPWVQITMAAKIVDPANCEVHSDAWGGQQLQLTCIAKRSTNWDLQSKTNAVYIILLHDNARLQDFRWTLFDHPPYSPDPAPSDLFLFLHFKQWLGRQRFETEEGFKNPIVNWFNSQAASSYAEGFKKLVQRYEKCLEVNGDYVEK